MSEIRRTRTPAAKYFTSVWKVRIRPFDLTRRPSNERLAQIKSRGFDEEGATATEVPCLGPANGGARPKSAAQQSTIQLMRTPPVLLDSDPSRRRRATQRKCMYLDKLIALALPLASRTGNLGSPRCRSSLPCLLQAHSKLGFPLQQRLDGSIQSRRG